MSATKDYFPASDAQRDEWFQTYKTQISSNGAAVGVEGEELDAQIEACTTCVTAFADWRNKKSAFDAAVETKNLAVKNMMNNVLRPGIKRLKTAPGYTSGIGAALGVIGSDGDGTSPDDYKAKISAEVVGGFVRIKFVKGIAQGINIYHRLRGSGAWAFLARDTKSPYDDHIEIPAGGAPQHWEYQAYGLIDDQQIGQPSNIVEAVIG